MNNRTLVNGSRKGANLNLELTHDLADFYEELEFDIEEDGAEDINDTGVGNRDDAIAHEWDDGFRLGKKRSDRNAFREFGFTVKGDPYVVQVKEMFYAATLPGYDGSIQGSNGTERTPFLNYQEFIKVTDRVFAACPHINSVRATLEQRKLSYAPSNPAGWIKLKVRKHIPVIKGRITTRLIYIPVAKQGLLGGIVENNFQEWFRDIFTAEYGADNTWLVNLKIEGVFVMGATCNHMQLLLACRVLRERYKKLVPYFWDFRSDSWLSLLDFVPSPQDVEDLEVDFVEWRGEQIATRDF